MRKTTSEIDRANGVRYLAGVGGKPTSTPAQLKFDELVGQAMLQGTLTTAKLLQEMRAHIGAGVPLDLDSIAHTLLEL